MSGFCRASVKLAALCALALASASCNYTFRQGGGFPEHVRTVFIAPLDNETVQVEVEQLIFRALTDRLPRSLGVRLAGERSADAVIRGTVTRYENVAQNYRPGDTGNVDVLQHTVQITMSLQIVDVRRNEILFESTGITGRGEYRPDSQSENTARTRAVEVLVQQIVDGAQKQW